MRFTLWSRCTLALFLCLVASMASASINNITVPFLGVPLTAFTMAAIGSACAFAWSQATASRGQLFFVHIASTIVGATSVRVIPHLFHLDWPLELQPPLAFLFGLMAPWVVPAFRKAVPSFFKGTSDMLVKMVGQKVDRTGNDYGGGYGGGDYTPHEYIPRDDEKEEK